MVASEKLLWPLSLGEKKGDQSKETTIFSLQIWLETLRMRTETWGWVLTLPVRFRFVIYKKEFSMTPPSPRLHNYHRNVDKDAEKSTMGLQVQGRGREAQCEPGGQLLHCITFAKAGLSTTMLTCHSLNTHTLQ